MGIIKHFQGGPDLSYEGMRHFGSMEEKSSGPCSAPERTAPSYSLISKLHEAEVNLQKSLAQLELRVREYSDTVEAYQDAVMGIR